MQGDCRNLCIDEPLYRENRISNRTIVWIDCAKAAAIFAVLIDHTIGVLYHNSGIGVISYYSVSLFILLMGITTYISETKYVGGNVWDRIKRRIAKIFWPYVVATFIYSIAVDHMFDFESFIFRLFHFNASSPFYYVFLYIQLIFVNAVLYQIIQKCNRCKYSWIYKLLVGMGLLVMASLTTLYSNMLDIYGGGGKLFGGTYMVLSYVGMIIAPYLINRWKIRFLLMVAVGTSILCAGVFYYNITGRNFFWLDAKLPFGNGINPPGITLMCYALIVLFWCFSISSICEAVDNIIIKKMIAFIKMIGENSLYIFLYHRLMLDFVLYPYIEIDNMWIKRIVYMFCMIGIPILGKKTYMEMKRKWRQ